RHARLALAPEAELGPAQAHAELDHDARAQRVVHLLQERELALERLERLGGSALQKGELPEPHVAAHDQQALLARDERLLQLRGPAAGPLAALKVLEQRAAVRELERRPARLRVLLERALVIARGLGEIGFADEQRA